MRTPTHPLRPAATVIGRAARSPGSRLGRL